MHNFLHLTLFLTFLTRSLSFIPLFTDVTIQAGIDIGPEGFRNLLKYGGPTIADLDGDGFYDLIFVHHGSQSVQVYFNKGDGTFIMSPFQQRRDNHGLSAFRLPRDRDRYFSLIPGGGNGLRPNFPDIFRVAADRKITNVTTEVGVNIYTGRGRSVVVMPLQRKRKRPDLVYLNVAADPESCPGCTDGQYDPYAYTGGSPTYETRELRGFNPIDDNIIGLAIDPDGDRLMELLTYRTLHLHRLVGWFKFKDVSEELLGEHAYALGAAAVAEIDFDNDGDFDLYIAREKTGGRALPDGEVFPDLLLENRNGTYVNVAVEAGIPQDTISRGVTVGDFNNDGLMDIYVSVLRFQPDMLLLNNGDGTFRKIDIGIGKEGAFGDNAMAVDYDNDGRVDLVRSEGDWENREFGGQYRILRNAPLGQFDGIGKWIKIRVGHFAGQTSLHAVVVVVANGISTMQRVGPSGASMCHSYFDTLHFGIGNADRADVTVTWANGVVRKGSVRAGVISTFAPSPAKPSVAVTSASQSQPLRSRVPVLPSHAPTKPAPSSYLEEPPAATRPSPSASTMPAPVPKRTPNQAGLRLRPDQHPPHQPQPSSNAALMPLTKSNSAASA